MSIIWSLILSIFWGHKKFELIFVFKIGIWIGIPDKI